MRSIRQTFMVLCLLSAALIPAAGCQPLPEPPDSSDNSPSVPVSAASPALSQPETLYEKKLSELIRDGVMQEQEPHTIFYDWFDLDGDGQWELIVSMGTGQDGNCWLYTCEGDQVIPIDGHCGEKGCLRYYPECRLIVTEAEDGDEPLKNCYRLNNKQLLLLYSCGVRSRNGEKTYVVNGEAVEPDEYDRLTAEYAARYPLIGEYVTLGRNRQWTI